MAAAPSKQQVIAARNDLVVRLGACVAVIVVVHVLPKDYAPRSTWRLFLTTAYFAAALYGLWQLLERRSGFFRTLYAWMYEDAPPSMDRLWLRYHHAIDQLVGVMVYILLALIGSTALSVYAMWFPGIGGMSAFYNLVWWFAVVALVLAPFASGNMINEIRQTRGILQREVATGYFKPRAMKDLVGPDVKKVNEDRPVVVKNERTFSVGGRDWQWEDLTKNCVIFGQTGSGKTICVLNPLIDAIIASTAKSKDACGGLVLDPKGDFQGKLRKLLKKHGRERDLLVIDPARPDESIRWNPLDNGDDELEIAARFAAVLECLGMKESGSSFWIDSAKKFIRHAVALIRLTNPPEEPPQFRDIAEMAASFEAICDRTDRLDVSDSRCEQCLSFFANEWSDLADETRSSIQAYITNMVDPFLMEPYATVFAGKSTMRIADMIERGKILYVNMPVADKEAMSKTIGTFVKLEYFREVLKRPDKRRPTFFLCDEFQSFFTVAAGKGDADFFERNRQSNHVNIIATQNLQALLKVSDKKEPVHNLLGNCLVKIFLRNTDEETNKYASSLFGQELVAMGGGGVAGMGVVGGRGGYGGGSQASDQYDSVVRPERFVELAIPSRAHGTDFAEAIVHDASGGVIDRHAKKLRWKVHPI